MQTASSLRLVTLGTRGPLGAPIDFPVRVLGRSRAPIVARRLGEWWVEPVSARTRLPSRARGRLQVLLSAGVQIKAVVLFHEIPGVARRRSTWESLVVHVNLWLQQESPIVVEQALEALASTLKKHAPVLGRLLLSGGTAVLTGIALVALAAVLAAPAVIGVALSDPCLVVVTEDGYWIEVDRWDE